MSVRQPRPHTDAEYLTRSEHEAGNPPLLDVEEAAHITGTTVRMMRRLIAQQALPVVKIGRYVRIRPADLDAYIVRNTRPAR